MDVVKQKFAKRKQEETERHEMALKVYDNMFYIKC